MQFQSKFQSDFSQKWKISYSKIHEELQKNPRLPNNPGQKKEMPERIPLQIFRHITETQQTI